MKQFLKNIFQGKKKQVNARQQEHEAELSREVKGQLTKLKEKGLSIPIFTL